jgi:hypothetical protein
MMTHFRQIYDDLPESILVPRELRHRRVEVILLPLGEPTMNGRQPEVDDNGWPISFFEETFSPIPDFPEREPQGNYEFRDAIKMKLSPQI